MNYFEFHLGDYAQDTGHLSHAEHGAYLTLLRLYYRRCAPLPADVEETVRLATPNVKDDPAVTEAVLREFFVEAPDGWHQKRCDKDIERFLAKRSKAKASADARWLSERNANAMPTQCQGNALQSPVPSPQSPKKKRGEPRRRGTPIPEDFVLTEALRNYALQRVYDMDTGATFEDFRNHHMALGTIGLDWSRYWYKWVSNIEKGYRYVRAKTPERRSNSEKVNAWEWHERQRAALNRKQDGPRAAHAGVAGGEEPDAGGDDPQKRPVGTGPA